MNDWFTIEQIDPNTYAISEYKHWEQAHSYLECLVGDAAAHMLPFAGTKYCVIFICDMDQYYQSWEKIIRAGAKCIFPAHGNPFSVEKLKQNMRKNKAENRVLYK